MIIFASLSFRERLNLVQIIYNLSNIFLEDVSAINKSINLEHFTCAVHLDLLDDLPGALGQVHARPTLVSSLSPWYTWKPLSYFLKPRPLC